MTPTEGRGGYKWCSEKRRKRRGGVTGREETAERSKGRRQVERQRSKKWGGKGERRRR
jgi:hypothetical protein